MASPDARLDQLPLGSRVVVRHRLRDEGRATDALGDLVDADDAQVTVHTRTGRVTIARGDVVAAKAVPPRVWRLRSFLQGAGIAVLDLDGVLRDFGHDGARARSERELGMAEFGLAEMALDLPEARQMVVGRSTHALWLDALRARLVAMGHQEDLVSRAVRSWSEDRGRPIRPTADLVDDLVTRGIPVFVFTNGSDRVPAELRRIGLARLVPMLVNAHDLGAAKPTPEAYALAHAEIERRLGHPVARAEVRFTDDRSDNVAAAREFGWLGQVFALPPD